MIYPATLLCDFYKVSHREQYPKGTEKIYSTWTPRESRIEGVDKVVMFGLQGFIKKYLIEYFNENFFSRPEQEIVDEYQKVIKATLGGEAPAEHIRALHKLGYLPLQIKALREGTRVPIRVPMFTIENTVPEFYWVTNYIETLMSCSLWLPMTSATLAFRFKEILTKYAKETSSNLDFVHFQGHDFSMRGHTSLESTKTSGAGHLTSFVGTDTIPGILYLVENYGAELGNELVGTSIPATEHSVMCAYGKDYEIDAYRKIIKDVYPKGFVSIVSDTWDLWSVLIDIIAPLKEEILSRDGKVVIRPDSGDPVKIICGDSDEKHWARKGVVEVLWDIFGGTVNEKGYKELDPHIGVIYGDAINLERCEKICKGLKAKGFASTNMVFGIGSYTYQYNSRDTFGFALKSTYARIKGKEVFLHKNPVTDSGVKKSQTGMVAVFQNQDGNLSFGEKLNESDKMKLIGQDLLEDVFIDGKLVREQNLKGIRERLNNDLS